MPGQPYSVIVGLGNPGPQYLLTRHNVGFLVLDAWADEEALAFRDEKKWLAHIALAAPDVRLVKPSTYMNESGRAVHAVLEWLKLTASSILVVVDDIALPLGQIRFRPEGSSGGHNGLKSIEQHLGTTQFARLRCGVDPVPAGWSQEKWVLSRFQADEEEALGRMIQTSRLAIECCQREGIAVAMNRFNGLLPGESNDIKE